ncbi:MAG: ATP synthase F1 subunit epsilon [Clostridiales bacterium]|nr:ATP synthase F1 subunit epsilon [Clostridiales bacterium]MDO4351125.1 ATP synthase F1 subunit epsilon [Eubacteriales bacterium]MDY4008235.1 ATP synthase F1 subunit epsilon [Candidatus Limiplasma sp.]
MATFHLQIVTPDRMVFDGEAERILVRTVGGDVCILAHHIDYAAPLSAGEARVTDAEGNTRVAACSGGMLGVSGGEVRVMATTFEWAEDIDLARAERAHKEALQRLEALERSDRDFAIAEAKLKRAIARIHVKG